MKKIVGWLALALVVYYVASSPTEAASTAGTVLGLARSVGDGLITFLKSLSN